MAALVGLGLAALLRVQQAAAIAVGGGGRAAPVPPAAEAVVPKWLRETWELAADDRAAEENFTFAKSGQPQHQYTPPPRTSIMEFKEDGLCFASPVIDAVQEHWDKIRRNVQNGRQKAQNIKVIFAGLIRNSEGAVYDSWEMLARIGSNFKDYHILLYENDSEDKTVERMAKIARKDPRYEFRSETLSYTDERGLEHSRLARMAILRNKLHDWIAEFVRKDPGWDLVAMYDFDLNLFGEHAMMPHGFLGALGRQEDWDMICANSLRHHGNTPFHDVGYYDCFAFREKGHDEFNQPDCGDTISKMLYSQYDLVPVHSCFGGMAMYKLDKYMECRYDPRVYDCEHVALHKCMRGKGSEGRMFMDPMMTTIYDPWIKSTCLDPDERYKYYRTRKGDERRAAEAWKLD